MKIRDSGMPDESIWEQFFEPTAALKRLGFAGVSQTVADFGCGYGTFSLAAARLTTGAVHAIDIDPHMLGSIDVKAAAMNLTNVRTVRRDILADGTGLPDSFVDYVMLFNVLHAEEPEALVAEAFRVLRPRATLAAMHWIADANTPRGPALSIRPRPQQCIDWLIASGFDVSADVIDLPPYHFGVIARKKS